MERSRRSDNDEVLDRFEVFFRENYSQLFQYVARRLPAHAVLDEQRIETVGNSSRERRPRIDRELHRCPIDENAPLLPIRSPKAESLQRILQIGESSSSVAG